MPSRRRAPASPRGRGIGLALALALASLPATGGAHQEEPEAKPSVVVLQPAIVGEIAPHWRDVLLERFVDRLSADQFEVRVDDSDAASCSDAPCWQRVATEEKAAYLLAVHVEVDEHDYRVRVDLLHGESGRRLARGEDDCEVCGVQEVGDMLADQAAVVRQKVETLLSSPPVLVISTHPSGARVSLDSRVVGDAPLRHRTTPGPHRLRVDRAGYVSVDMPVDATPGLVQSIDVQLSRLPKIERARPWGWAMIGVGAASIIAGTTLLVLHERPYRLRCTGSNVDDFGNCRFDYRTRTSGIVFTALGAAVLTAGALVVGIARRRARKKSVR